MRGGPVEAQANTRGLQQILVAALVLLAFGVALGGLWWVAAPVAWVEVGHGQVSPPGRLEVQVAQDGWFAIITGLTGVLAASVLALRPGRSATTSAVLGPLLGVLVALVAWRAGVLLGVAWGHVSDGPQRPAAPLRLHAYGVLFVGPLLFAVTRFLAALFSADEWVRR